MATFNKFHPFAEAVCEKKHNFSSDVFKVFLTNEAPLAADAVKADIAEIAAGNGYTAGGLTIPIVSSSQTAGTYTAAVNTTQVVTATGAIGPFRYAVMFNDTATNDELVGFWDYGSAITMASGETFTFAMNANLITLS